MNGIWSEFAEEGLDNNNYNDELRGIKKVDVVEEIARMNMEERRVFVRDFAKKWPDLARSISNSIDIEIRDNELYG